MSPGRSAIGRLVDAVADRNAVAGPAFAGSDPHIVWVPGVDRHGADGLHGLLVEDGLERGSAVVGAPDAAGCRSDEQTDLSILALVTIDRGNAARHRCRTDIANIEARNRGAVKALGAGGADDRGGDGREEKIPYHG